MYDSQETYFADSAAEWTDNPENVLRREPKTGDDAVILAAARPREGQERLTLDFLAEVNYPNGARVHVGDQISNAGTDYREQYARLRAPQYANRVHGRAKEGSDGRVWLQYWLWYFYNDYTLALDIGLHEGDWEMVQLRMAEDLSAPDLAVYAQHTHAERRPWDAVRTVDGHPDTPLVFPGRGSHASYFEHGLHTTEVWYDVVDGRRPAPELQLELLDDLPWAEWPGRWGDTPSRVATIDQPSPMAPCEHRQWDDPAKLLKDAVEHDVASPADAPREVTVERDGDRMRLRWDLRRHPNGATAIVLNVNSEDEPHTAPRAYTYDVSTAPAGQLDTSIALDRAKHYDVYVSVSDGAGVPSAARAVPFDVVRNGGFDPASILRAVGRFVAWLRGGLQRQ